MTPENMKTTFWSDFTIADAFGVNAIKDTAKRAKSEWLNNVEYYTELVAVLNWKCWYWYEKENQDYCETYRELFEKYYDIGYDHFKGDDLNYFWKELD